MKKKGNDSTGVNTNSGNIGCDVLRAREKIDTCALELRGPIKSAVRTKPLEICSDTVMKEDVHIKGNLCVDGDIKKTTDGVFDVIIIGAGAAGAVVANKISEDPDTSVLVLEQGKNLNSDPIVNNPFGVTGGKLNLFLSSVMNSDAISTSDTQGGPVSNDDRWLWRYESGKAIGGASVHNYLEGNKTSPGFQTFMATRAGAYSSLWDAAAANSTYQAMEHYYGLSSQPNRGYSGPMPLVPTPPCSLFGQHYLAAIAASSNAPADNALGVTGDGDALAVNNNVDLSLSKQYDAYLTPSFNRAHTGIIFLGPDTMMSNGIGIAPRQLRVIDGALVDHIEFDTGGVVPVAKRVHVIKDGKCYVYEARKKIILSAGSIRTPGILERSGVGDPSILTPLGIPVVVANPNVGKDVTNGTCAATLMQVAPGIMIPGDQPTFKIQLDANPPPYHPAWIRRCQGLIAGGTFPPFEPTNALLKAYGLNTNGANNYLGAIFNLQPTSVGSVHIYDRTPGSTPIFISNTPSTDEDIRIQREGLLLVKRVEQYLQANYPADGFVLKYPPPAAYTGYPGAPTNVFTGFIVGNTLNITAVTSGAIELGCTITGAGISGNTRVTAFLSGTGGTGTYTISKSYTLGPTTINSDSLELYAASFQIGLYHASSSCKMGDLNTQAGVVDGQLHVYGTKNLMIADSSIFPVASDSGQLGAMMVGWKAAEIYFSTV